MLQIIIEIFDRIRTESPRFFIVLRWLFGALAAVSVAVKWIILKDIWRTPNGPAISELCGYVLTAAGAIWGTSFLPTRDKPTTWQK